MRPDRRQSVSQRLIARRNCSVWADRIEALRRVEVLAHHLDLGPPLSPHPALLHVRRDENRSHGLPLRH